MSTQPTPNPVAAATETLRRYLEIALASGWGDSAAAIRVVIERIESAVF